MSDVGVQAKTPAQRLPRSVYITNLLSELLEICTVTDKFHGEHREQNRDAAR